jgi:hypothetical protein
MDPEKQGVVSIENKGIRNTRSCRCFAGLRNGELMPVHPVSAVSIRENKIKKDNHFTFRNYNVGRDY